MSKKVVVVDDEEDICQVFKAMLETHGFEVHTAGDGLEGKQVIERVNPDVLILDIMMPKMNGYQLLVTLRRDKRFTRLPVLMLTSLTQNSTKTDEQWRDSLAVSDFMSKPVSAQQLLEHVNRVLAG